VHGWDIASLDEVGRPSVTDEKRFELLVTYTGENGRVIDLGSISHILPPFSAPYLVAVQM
jgi:hypothetical protein